jgi:hypothetical protein
VSTAPTHWTCQCGVQVPMGCSHTCGSVSVPATGIVAKPLWPIELIAAYEALLAAAEASLAEARAENERLRVALRYIARPTMSLPSGADAAEFAMTGADERSARVALTTCITMAASALTPPPSEPSESVTLDNEASQRWLRDHDPTTPDHKEGT